MKNRMDKHTEKILEYDKIRDILITYTVTDFGKEICSMMVPSKDKEEAVKLLDRTDDAVKLILKKNAPPLDGFKNIINILDRADSGAILSCEELYDTRVVLEASERLKKFLKNIDDELKKTYICLLISRFLDTRELKDEIFSAVASRDELHDDASKKLLSIRKKIKKARSDVKKTLESVIKDNRENLQEQLITMRGNRYVVMVKADRKSFVPGIIHDTSSSEATIFVEPYKVVEINNRIREYISEEREETERILKRLSLGVKENSDAISNNIDHAGQIDFTVAKAKMAIKTNSMPPEVNDENYINLIDARHPLIPENDVVPISIEIGKGYRTLVITGPNTGGKTVSLKTCGLLNLMAASGLFIPAKETSSTCVFNKVYADIGDEQSIEQSLSTFSSHMTNLVKIIQEADNSTLVLADELGSGTDPASGAALAMAILDYLKERGCITLATTHYKELKHYAISTEGVENAGCEFDIKTLMPTYRLFIGTPGTSNAFYISSRLGLPNYIIDKAKDFLSKEELKFEELSEQTAIAKKNAEEFEKEAKEKGKKLEKETLKIKELRKELDNIKEDTILRMRKKLREDLDSRLEEADEMLEKVKESIKEQELNTAKEQLEEFKRKLQGKINGIDNKILESESRADESLKTPESLIVGNEYFSVSLNIGGVLDKIDKNKGVGVLISGNKRVSVPISSLRLTESNNRTKTGGKIFSKGSNTNYSHVRKSGFSNEVKLIGLSSEEACKKLDKYLDDAILSGAGDVRIVHGKGTGILRKAVTSMLKNDKRIKSYRIADFGEGDTGVTIATL